MLAGVDLVVNHDVRLDAVQAVSLRRWGFIVIDHEPVPVVVVRPDALNLERVGTG
ncbi:hypothetical protein D3C84_972560 [compost metagenome]